VSLAMTRFPGAARHEVVRCRPGIVTVFDDPGSAVRRCALHWIRETKKSTQ
jgi:hypothetical protein